MSEQSDQLLLIDLSAIAHQIWHVSGSEPDPNHVSTELIARVRALASAHLHAAVCCDSGKSFRADIDPTYKANRDTENRAPLKHQMTLACEVLAKDGFPIWSAKGFEADDLIATATREALAINGTTVLIASADKDLLQLVNDRVTMKKITDGNVMDAAAVFDKFGVKPSQMGDLLALMGDKSDNIVGAEKIGAVIGARLLSEHGTLSALYEKMAHGVVSGVTATMRTSLMAFKDRWPTVAKLIALRTDAPIPFHEIGTERAAPPMEEAKTLSEMTPEEFGQFEEVSPEHATAKVAERIAASAPPPTSSGEAAIRKQFLGGQSGGGKSDAYDRARETLQVYPPVEFSQQLEPRSMPEAVQLAQRMYESRLFGAYGTPQAVLATVLAGRELGIPAMASLRAFHIIEGKPQLSAGTIQSLVLKSGRAKYFRCSERTATRATFVTQRGDDPEMALSYTIEEGRAAWPKDETAWNKSGWGRNPADMLVARASSKLARLVYPDVVSGLYAPEEMD